MLAIFEKIKNGFKKIAQVFKKIYIWAIKNINVVIFWAVMFYFFPTFTTVVFLIIGIPFIFVVLSAIRAVIVYNKEVILPGLSTKEAYQERTRLAKKYLRFNKLARLIFINTIETAYREETITTKDNVLIARYDLNLPEVFNEQDVKKAWKDLLKDNHPDLVEEHLKETATKRTMEINQAKETLMTYLKDNGVLSKLKFK